jgi:hypothetical protein
MSDQPPIETALPPHPIAVRLQILGNEHWSLLASRSLAWNESFSRAAMYLSALSGSLVALGLVATIDRGGSAFLAFAYVIIPVVLFLGIATSLRMAAANYHDALTVVGMNRIRAAYVALAPDLAPTFVFGMRDDPVSVQRTMAQPPGSSVVLRLISATPFMIQALNAVLAGAFAGLVVAGASGAALPIVIVSGVTTALVAAAVQLTLARRLMARAQRSIQPLHTEPVAEGGR